MSGESVSEGRVLELVIDGVGAGGEGIGHAGGRAVFVPFAAQGERVRVRIAHVGRRRVVADLVEVIEASEDRVEPACEVFGRCGGCQLMHLRYPAQLRLKQTVLRDALRSLAGIDWEGDLEVAAADPALDYRNRGQYPVAIEAGRVVTGFFAPRSHRVVPVERCPIHHPELDGVVAAVRAWAGRKRVPVYDEHTRRGWLRHVVVRRSHAQGQVLVTLVGAGERGGGHGDLVRLLRKRVRGVCGLVFNDNPAASNVILGRRNRVLWGRGWIEERLSGLRFRLGVGSFFQVNTPQAGVLFDQVRSFCAQTDRTDRTDGTDGIDGIDGPLVDAYCGVGVLALLLAAEGHEVIGIEMLGSAVADARRAAGDNGLKAVFNHGRVEAVLPRLVEQGLRPAAVVLNPPRKGCDPEVLRAVAASGCSRVAYISCHPGTLARDLARLFEHGFGIERLSAVDMFPQTAHLETFAGLVRN